MDYVRTSIIIRSIRISLRVKSDRKEVRQLGQIERKEKEKQIKKQDILDAAERIFFKNGYEKTTMDEVAKEAEFSKRTVYVYFKSKEEIYFHIMIHGYHILIDFIKEDLMKSKIDNAVEELQILFQSFYRFKVEQFPYFISIMTYETSKSVEDENVDPLIKKECYQLGEEIFQYMADIIKRGIEEKRFCKTLDIEKTALILWASTLGIFNTVMKKSQYIKDYHHIEEKDFLQSGFDLLLKSILILEE